MKGDYNMLELERKTEEFLLDSKEEMRATHLKYYKEPSSVFLDMETDRKSTISLPVNIQHTFSVDVNVDDLDF